MSKVSQCYSCGQFFDENNYAVGKAVPTKKCSNGTDHEGPIVAVLQSSDNAYKRIEEKLEIQNESLKEYFNEKINVVRQQILHLSLASLNAYDNITQSTSSKKSERQINIRTRYYKFCGFTTQSAYCVVTGQHGQLKLAHLLPVSADKDTLKILKLSDDDNGIWSLRNVLLLSWNIERYYDQLKLSFLPNPLHVNKYYMKIWDSSIKQEPIFEGAREFNETGDNLIGFYDGKDLNLKITEDTFLEPFKRCLTYHAFYCCLKSNGVNKFEEDFFSNIGSEWPTFRSNLIALKGDLQKVIAEETNGENDENELEQTEEDEGDEPEVDACGWIDGGQVENESEQTEEDEGEVKS